MALKEEQLSASIKTKNMTLIQAITDGLATMLEEDERILLLGEDIGKNGGVFRATEGLQERFGQERVMDTPLKRIRNYRHLCRPCG